MRAICEACALPSMGHTIREAGESTEGDKSQLLVGKSPWWLPPRMALSDGEHVSQASGQVQEDSKDPSINKRLLLSLCKAANYMKCLDFLLFFLNDMPIFLNQFWWGFIFSGYRITHRNTTIRLMPLFISHVDPHGRGCCDRPTNNKVDNSQVAKPSNFLIL